MAGNQNSGRRPASPDPEKALKASKNKEANLAEFFRFLSQTDPQDPEGKSRMRIVFESTYRSMKWDGNRMPSSKMLEWTLVMLCGRPAEKVELNLNSPEDRARAIGLALDILGVVQKDETVH